MHKQPSVARAKVAPTGQEALDRLLDIRKYLLSEIERWHGVPYRLRRTKAQLRTCDIKIAEAQEILHNATN